jgi:hypothetical protein
VKRRSLLCSLALCAPVAVAVGPTLTAHAATTSPSPGFVTLRSLGQGTSPALRSVPAKPVAAGHTGNYPYRPVPHRRVPGALVTDPGTLQTTTTTAAATTGGIGFAGNSNSDAVLPPDTNGDIGYDAQGNAWYVQWVNLHYQMWERLAGQTTWTSKLTAPGNTVFSALNNLCSSTNDGDPIVTYDRMAKRWVLTQFAFGTNWLFGTPTAPYGQCVAVSQTSDPTGAYNLYSWDVGHFGNTDYFPDYPKLGVWPNGYYLTFNYFSGNNLQNFNGAGVVILDRNTMLSGGNAQANASGPLGSSIASMLPVTVDDNTAPAGPESLVAADTNNTSGGSALQWWHLDNVTWGQQVSASLKRLSDLSVAPYNWYLCSGSRNCIPQPGTSVGLDSLSDRLMYRAGYRTVNGEGHVILNHTVNAASSGTHAAIRWYDVTNVDNTTDSTPTLVQQGTYSPDAANRWMGSAAMDSAGDIAIGYSVSSSSIYPSIRYAGRVPSDPVGTLEAEATLKAGGGSQTHSSSRWGDYSSLVVDPQDGCTFWYTNEYYSATASYSWKTWIGSFSFPGCGGSTVTAPATPTGLTVTGVTSTSVSLSWSPVSTATSYAVQRATGTGSPVQIASGLTSTTYTDSTVSPSTTYSYTVTASNSGGTSAPSGAASATTLASSSTPSTPTGLTVTSKSGTSIGLAWTASSGATGYVLQRSTSSNFSPATSIAISGGSTTYTDTGLSRATTYYYRLEATNGSAVSGWSNVVRTKTLRR